MRWVIGDVHGMRVALEALLHAVSKRDSAPRFIFAGDYVNRGPDSRGVLDLLPTLTDAVFVRGNHDDVLDVILNSGGYCDHPPALDPVGAFSWFIQHGLADTLASYGADYADIEYAAEHPSGGRVFDVVSGIPDAHRAFIRGLPPVYEDDDLFVMHAMWDPYEDPPSIAERLAAKPAYRFKVLWGRYGEKDIASRKRWRRTGYFGHTPVQSYRPAQFTPMRGPHIVLLDTAAALLPDGRLSAVCHETGECVQVERSGEVVEGE